MSAIQNQKVETALVSDMLKIILDQIQHLLDRNVDRSQIYLTTLDGFFFSPNSVFFDNLSPQPPDTFEAVKLLTT